MDVPKGLDSTYERDYYEALLKDCEVVDKKTIFAQDEEAMKRELAFTMLFPVHHDSGKRCIWFPCGKAELEDTGCQNIWKMQMILITVPAKLGEDYLDFLTHPGYTVMNACRA